MSRTDPQFKLRMPPALRALAERSAKAARRSLNAELVVRLQQSFAQEVPADDVEPVSAPAARHGLRLLCVFHRQARAAIFQPVAVSRLPAPWAPLQGKWPLALPAPLFLREARSRAPSAAVLARCLRQRPADALRPRARAL